MTKCVKCGQCCYWMSKGEKVKCKHLVVFKNTTLCRIFKHRIGVVLQKQPEVKCVETKNREFDFVNCPFNTNKPEFGKSKYEV